jgi:hypothetical protein
VLELWLGGFFAWCAAARLRADGVWAQPAVLLVALYGAIVLAPATIYLTLAYPDWSWLYLFPATRLPGLAAIPLAASAIAALIGGWFGVGRLVVLGVDRRRIAMGLGGVAGVLLLVVIAARARVFSWGTTADFRAGRALSIFEVKLGYVLIALAIGAIAAGAFVAWELFRDGRKASSR